MLDIRLIREKPDFVRERLATRGGGDDAKIAEVLRVDAERRTDRDSVATIAS
jgi:seryl-tRNA synthetase